MRGVVNEIVVTPGPDDGTRAEKPRLPDAEIATYVRAQLRRDHRVDDSRIQVRVFAGRVSLSGSVPEDHQRDIAAEDARNTVGVEGVTDEVALGVEAC